MRTSTLSLMVIAATLVLVMPPASCTYDKAPFAECDTVSVGFASDIRPLITLYCSAPALGDCHDGHGSLGQPNYTAYEGIKAQVDNGKLERQVFVTGLMPPEFGSTGPTELTPEHQQLLKCWIVQGALNN